MSKEALLQDIKRFASKGMITKRDLLAALEAGEREGKGGSHHLDIEKILYFIGGFIVFLGISILIWQNWDDLTTTTKILATFGSGLAAYLAGVMFSLDKRYETAYEGLGKLTKNLINGKQQ